MKNLILLIVILFFASCRHRNYNGVNQRQTQEIPETSDRVMERISFVNSHSVYVFKYEGHKYFSTSRGGVYHLESCDHTKLTD